MRSVRHAVWDALGREPLRSLVGVTLGLAALLLIFVVLAAMTRSSFTLENTGAEGSKRHPAVCEAVRGKMDDSGRS